MGILFGVYLSFGLSPLYWNLLHGVSALEMVSHRSLWGSLIIAAFMVWKGQFPAFFRAIRDRREIALIGLCSLAHLWNGAENSSSMSIPGAAPTVARLRKNANNAAERATFSEAHGTAPYPISRISTPIPAKMMPIHCRRPGRSLKNRKPSIVLIIGTM